MADDVQVVEEQAVTPETVTTPTEKTVESVEESTPQAEDEKKFTQKELDEIIQKRIAKEAARAERRALKVYADKLERMAPSSEPKAQATPDSKPTMAQFANVEDYVEAVAEWKLTQREQTAQKQQVEVQQREMLTKTEKIYSQAEKIEGFDRDTFDDLPITTPIAQAIIESDVAPKLMAYMVSNPEEVDRIAKYSPARQAAEIGKLEAKLSVSAPVKVSKVPDPIKPIGNRGGANSDLSKSSMEDYIAMRSKQGARWAR